MNINVLSLFDGMSCGQIALNRAEIKYNKYYASEIKPIAIIVKSSLMVLNRHNITTLTLSN